MVGYVEAITVLGAQPTEIKILSIGTGIGEKYYKVKDRKGGWGLINGWGGSGLVDLMMNLQSKNTHNMIKLLLPDDHYIRVNFSRDHKLSLDEVESLSDLRSIAERLFAQYARDMTRLIEVNQNLQ